MTLRLELTPGQEDLLRRALGGDLTSAALEAMVINGYRTGKLTCHEVGQVLGHTSRWQTERWLADRKVYMNYSIKDLEDELEAMDRVLGKIA